MTIKHDNCKNCSSRCIHAGKDRDFVCVNGVSCKITTEKQQTNADRIRAMSDEELASWMAECNAYRENAEASQWLPWLQQPAEEG